MAPKNITERSKRGYLAVKYILFKIVEYSTNEKKQKV